MLHECSYKSSDFANDQGHSTIFGNMKLYMIIQFNYENDNKLIIV